MFAITVEYVPANKKHGALLKCKMQTEETVWYDYEAKFSLVQNLNGAAERFATQHCKMFGKWTAGTLADFKYVYVQMHDSSPLGFNNKPVQD